MKILHSLYYKLQKLRKQNIFRKRHKSETVPLDKSIVLPSMGNREKIISAVKEQTKTQAIKINLEKDKKPEIFSSKIGGVPYWDKNMKYPETGLGKKLTMLAQINLSEISQNDKLPKEGILQFFILNNDLYGMNYQDSKEKNTYQIVYHKEEIQLINMTPCFYRLTRKIKSCGATAVQVLSL